MNTIITTIKNRCNVIFRGQPRSIYKNSLTSLLTSLRHKTNREWKNIPTELILVDFGSTDTDYQWVYELLDGIIFQLIIIDATFNLGLGRNTGADAATGDRLLFLDADMLFPSNFCQTANKYLDDEIIYCPISYEETLHVWQDVAIGNIIMQKNQFTRIGRWPEYCTWGKEDNDYFDAANKQFMVSHTKLDGFIHQSHERAYDETLKWDSNPIESYIRIL